MHGPKDVAVSRSKRLAAIGAGLALILAIAGCSTSSGGGTTTSGGKTISFNVGNGYTVKWKQGQQIKLAFFAYGDANSWQAAQIKAANDTAKKIGATLKVFNANGDAQAQYNQMQTALTSGDYNAWMFMPVDGTLVCNITTKLAPAKNILVVNEQAPVCGHDGASGAAARQPGIFGFVGGIGSSAMWNSIADYVAKANTGPTNAIVLSGPASVGSVKESNAAWAKMVKEHPNIKIVATEPTDFTTAVGFSATQTALAQHPDANIILSVYSGVTQGAVKAIQAAHDEGKVKLYDQGGDTASIAAIKEGAQTMTAPDFPYTEIQTVVNLIGNANTGKVTKPSSIMNDGTTWGQDGGSFFVTKANVDKFKPEY